MSTKHTVVPPQRWSSGPVRPEPFPAEQNRHYHVENVQQKRGAKPDRRWWWRAVGWRRNLVTFGIAFTRDHSQSSFGIVLSGIIALFLRRVAAIPEPSETARFAVRLSVEYWQLFLRIQIPLSILVLPPFIGPSLLLLLLMPLILLLLLLLRHPLRIPIPLDNIRQIIVQLLLHHPPTILKSLLPHNPATSTRPRHRLTSSNRSASSRTR
uniref:(northern house mosquito) hypothetical protein n=1 Tax=Culex pipiens TaxID=7175 RepID=A0A8D8FJT9_CULPI